MGRYYISLQHTNLIYLTLNDEGGFLLCATLHNNFNQIHLSNIYMRKNPLPFPKNIKGKKIKDHLMFNTLIKESFSIQLERTKYTMYNKVYRLKL